MIVEKSAFETASTPQPTPSTRGQTQARTRGRGRGRTQHAAASRNGAQYAVAHGQRRGMFSGAHDDIVQLDETHITSETLREAPGEGIYLYIQTTNCRRSLLQTVFCNEPSGV